MSCANRRFVTGYFLLVVLPIIAIIGILKQEQSPSAPLAVDGDWKLEVNSIDVAGLLCEKANLAAVDNWLTISQSGTRLVLDLKSDPSLTGSGVITGRFLKASFLHVQESQNRRVCTEGRHLILDAAVTVTAEPKTLAGTISVEACSSCAVLEFRAIRESLKAIKGTH